MRRITVLLLEIALLLFVVVALGYLVRLILTWFLPIQWYWGGALAALAGPALLCGALWLIERTSVSSGSLHHA